MSCTAVGVKRVTTEAEVSQPAGGLAERISERHAGGSADDNGRGGPERGERRQRSALGALADARGQFFDVVENFAALGHLGANLLLRVHHCGVIAAESLADLGQ